MLDKKQIDELFKKLEEKHGQPEGFETARLDECVEPSFSVEGIRQIADEFDMPLEFVRKLNLRQYFWLSMELDDRHVMDEPTFEQQQATDDTLAEMHKAGGIIEYLERRKKKKVQPPSVSILPSGKCR
ncbi:MAG: hypothetical protein PHG25_03070 [Candidatus Pacebacteria bacterium]|nr:hypothetical protein [Candidatus Paceibacterota bacterium]